MGIEAGAGAAVAVAARQSNVCPREGHRGSVQEGAAWLYVDLLLLRCIHEHRTSYHVQQDYCE